MIERRVDRGRRVDRKQRVTIRRRLHDGLGRDIGSGARPVLEHEWLPEALGQLLADQARHNVGATARRIADDDANRPSRIGLRARDAR